MSDSILPKIFEGFPELANQASSLEEALDLLAARVDAHLASTQSVNDGFEEIQALNTKVAQYETEKEELRAQIATLEAQTAENSSGEGLDPSPETTAETTALREEVSHWKEKYDALASKFDAEIEAAKASSIDESVVEDKDSEIAQLVDAKEKAGSEIARLAEALALARSEADGAKSQLDDVNAQLADVKADLGDAAPNEALTQLEDEVSSLRSALSKAEQTIESLTAAKQLAEAASEASEAARSKAAMRLGALIETLNSAQSAGAA